MATNLQTFSGEVEIPEGNLQLKRILELSGNNASTSNTGILFSRNLGSTSNSNVIVYFDEATESLRFGHTLNASSDSEIIMDSANVLNVNVFGEVEASYFKGDGGLLSNLVTDLQSVTENGAETDQTLVLTNAVTGIDVQTGNVNVAGNVTASIFFGDGGLLSNITQTLQGITEIGNTTSIALEFNNVTTGFVTTSNVGIVNTSPQHNFSVGSNLYVHDTDSNVLTVEGNVSAHKLTLGTIEITPAYGLENVTNISNLAHATLLFQNTTTAFVTTAMAGIGIEPDSSDVGASGLHVDGHLRLGGPAGTDENSDIYLRTAGQLNIESNDTDTDNQYTALALRAGNANESNIVVEGALSDTSKQYISFGVRNQERMKIDREGNVTVGYASTSHKLDVAGSANVTTLNASNLVINTVSISVQYDLDQTLENGNVSTNVITVGKVSVTDPTLAQTASNLVTWNATTKEFEDSGGLISNKLAIVSEQPPAALTGDSTVVDGHGRYKVTSSLEAGAYEGYKVFDKTIGAGTNGWSTGAVGAYNSNGTYAGSNVIAGVSGEWVKIELPYKTTLRHVALASRNSESYSSMPEDFSIVASNDDSTWVVLKSVDGQAWSTDYVNFVVDASTAYKYYAIVVELTNTNFGQIGEWKLFTETFTVDGGVVSTTAASGLDVGYTEHPVEPMRDFRTYVEGHGTYEASASSYDVNNPTEPWYAFDYGTTPPNRWSTSAANYDTSGIYAGNVTSTDIGGTRHLGEWLQIKLPYDITLSKIKLLTTTSLMSRAVTGGTILGSNDGTNWYVITTFSGLSHTQGEYATADINATTPYMYYRLVVKNVATGLAGNRPDIAEWRLFAEKPVTRMQNVHISGELSSETLQTGYIKWPRVPLKANESEGYVVSQSSSFNSNFIGFHAFEDKSEYTDGGTPSWASGSTSFSSGSAAVSRTTGSDTFYHEWLQIQLPQSIQLSYFNIIRRDVDNNKLNEAPKNGFMYGSNDGIAWTKLVSYSDLTYTDYTPTRVDVNSTNSYKYFRLAVTNTTYTSGAVAYTAINELQLFEAATGVGAAPTSAKLQVAGSLGMAKGAEFFAGDDVVMELPKHDRPLVKYPEVAMTAATTGGYTVSASSTYMYNYSWRAFNNVSDGNSWLSGNNTYNADGTASGATSVDTFEGIAGSWLGIQLPNKIKLQYINLINRTSDTIRNAKTGILWAKRDDTWVRIKDFSGLNTDSAVTNTIQVNATDFYKEYRLQITAIEPYAETNPGPLLSITELEYWGYEEGDASVDVVHRSITNKPGQQHLAVYWDANDSNSYSFADSSNVYDLSGNGVTGTITGTNGFDAEYNAWVFDGSGDYVSGTQGIGTGQVIHTWSLWVKNLTPTSTQYAYICGFGTAGSATMSGFMLRNGDRLEFNMYGTYVYVEEDFPNREGTWIHVVGVYRGNAWNATNCDVYIDGRKATTVGTATTTLNISGTAINIGSRPGGGQPFVGSIANARLYSKALNAEQVRELYEYDAPRFGHRQNLVALHKGNLGVGVAHPTSRFEVAGADGVQEFPPKAMTGYETYIEGHGVFRVSESSVRSGEDGAYALFNKDDGTTFWHSNNTSDDHKYTSDALGTYIGTSSIAGIGGEWVTLECPYSIKLESIQLHLRSLAYQDQSPEDWTLLGSNDGTDWETLKVVTGQIISESGTTFDVGASQYYKMFALVATRIANNVASSYTNALTFGEWRLFGTPAPSAIEDGHLTLGKALTLPRVSGHAAGAETPRAESLVLHYDTTVDSVVSGSTVVDISGTGINGTLTNGAAYSSTDRALTFDGVNDRITGTLNNPSGAWVNSVAFWFKRNVASGVSGYDYIYKSGISGGNGTSAMNIIITPTHELVWTIYNHTVFTPANTVVNDAWYHVVTVYRGGVVNLSNADIYVNGVKASNSTNGTAAATYPANATFVIGNNTTDNYNFNGSISNFKIWGGVALTAEEVAAEYALGRTGKSINLTDTSLCLGGTVPRAQLDVRGSARFDGRMIIGNSDQVADDLDDITPTLDVRGLDDSYIRAHCVTGRSAGLILSEGTNNQFIMEYEGAGAGAGNYVTFYSGETGWPNGAKGLGLNYVPQSGFVGIGRTNPVTPLHIKQNGTDGGGTADLDGQSNGGITVERSDTLNRWLQGINGNNNYHFWYDADGAGAATSKAFFDQDGSNNIDQNFTGQHRTFIKDIPFTQVGELEGLIVSADNNKYIKMSGGIEAGSNAITTNESLPVVSLSNKVNDKKCFGVISTSEDPETRENRFGNIVSMSDKELGDTRVYINSVGEGAMWVVNTNGPLESGDYITTSNVPGYGQKQDSEFLANYTVAKITMDCDFDPVTQPIQIIKKELANVNYWVKTTYSNVSLEEYSNLAEENRTTEDETYYTKDVELKYTYKPTVTVTSEDPWDDVSIWPSDATYAEWSNLEANVQNTYTLTYMQNDFDSTRYEKTTVSNVSGDDVWDTVDISPYISYDEWSNLEANVQNTFTITYMQSVTTTCTEEAFSNLTVEEQNTYTLVYTKTVTEEVSEPEGADEHTRTIYKKVERNETKTEPTEDADEWVLDVRQELVNILDEHGQLQWEDDPSGATEKAYKIRHLDASGQQTDEANAVHIAAFVGCTYHCG
jgi:hypothetical protein